MSNLLKTVLYDEHVKWGAKMVPFAGYQMPVQYQGILEETKACRAFGGIFDVSHMGQFLISGDQTFLELQKLVTNDVRELPTGKAIYTFLCNPKGGVIDDIIIYRLSETDAFICVNASNRLTDYNWLKSHLPSHLSFIDQSDLFCLIAVQGPKSETLLQQAYPNWKCEQLAYFGVKQVPDKSYPLIISRTGYTGEDGFEIYIHTDQAINTWKTLTEKGAPLGLVACGLGARDTLRLEMGYPLHGHEISQDITPLEAGLGWAVKSDQDFSFIGKEALSHEKQIGPQRSRVALILTDKRLARAQYPIANPNGEIVGEITSGAFSPHLSCPIALGLVQSSFKSSDHFLIKIRNDWVRANTTKLPFVPANTKASKLMK